MFFDKKVLLDDFLIISQDFKTDHFNACSSPEKYKILLDFSKIVAKSLGSKINDDNLLFVKEENLGAGYASFNFYDNVITN